MRKHIFLFVIGILLLLFTISFFGITEVFSTITQSDLNFVVIAVLCQIVILFLYAMRFKIITSKYKRLSFKDAFYISITGHFMDMITPVEKVGGQPVMIYLTKRKIGSAKSSAIVMADTVTDIFSLILLIVAVIFVLHAVIPYQILLPLIIFVFIISILAIGFLKLFLSENILGKLVKWLIAKIRWFRKINAVFGVHVFEKSFRGILKDKKIMSFSMAISFIIKFLEIFRLWIVFLAVGINLSPAVLLIVWSFMLLLLFIPWLPGNMGLYEFGSYSAFILFGVISSKAAGGVLLDRFVSFWFVLLFSLIVIWLSRHRVGEIIKLAGKK